MNELLFLYFYDNDDNDDNVHDNDDNDGNNDDNDANNDDNEQLKESAEMKRSPPSIHLNFPPELIIIHRKMNGGDVYSHRPSN